MDKLINISKQLYSNKPDSELKKFTSRKSLFTGIKEIDNKFGFPYGQYIILGNPGIGKSWFALWLTRVFFMYNQINSVYFSLEMPEQSVRSRLLQQWSDLNKYQFEGGASVEESLKMLRNDVIIVDTFFEDNTKMRTPENFERMVDEYYSYGYKVFHFDHLHELDGAMDKTKNTMTTFKWGEVFQRITKKYNDIWLFIFAQPNSEASKKLILKRTDIYGSKALTYKCDYVISINKGFKEDEWGIPQDDGDSRDIKLYVDKSRYTTEKNFGINLHLDFTGNFKSRDI